MMYFGEKTNKEIKEHALKCFPKEMCGVIVENQFIPIENVAENPENDFLMRTSDTQEYTISRKLQAIVHSHPLKSFNEKSSPSIQDMISQVSSNVTWGIVDTDGVNVRDIYWWGDILFGEALLGKEFHSGVNDCYSLIRKFYKQRMNVILPEFPREDSWWSKGGNLYMEGFEKAGFYKISKEDLQDGDVILGKVRSDVINHGGVIINNKEEGYGLILHHLPNRLSRREPAAPWVNKAEVFLRYRNAT